MTGAMPLVDRQLAVRAVNLALPMIEAAMADPKINDNRFLHIVVMDPCAHPRQDPRQGIAAFEQAILHEHSVGDRAQWDADYSAFARAKARTGWDCAAVAHISKDSRPWLLHGAESRFWGSAALDLIVVGVSGMRPCYDEAVASVVAACLKALAKDRVQQARCVVAA